MEEHIDAIKLEKEDSVNTESQSEVQRSKPNEIRNEGQLLQALINHWIHEDVMYWTQIRHALVLELAVLASFYTLKTSWLNLLVMILATVVSFLFFRFAEKIRINRNVNEKTITQVSLNVASDQTLKYLNNIHSEAKVQKRGVLRLTKHGLEGGRDAGRKFQIGFFSLCILVNVILGGFISYDLWRSDVDLFGRLTTNTSDTKIFKERELEEHREIVSTPVEVPVSNSQPASVLSQSVQKSNNSDTSSKKIVQ